MNLKQLTLDKLKGLILRLWPGLAGYHVIRYAKITKVYEGQSLDLATVPGMKVDLQFAKHDFSKDNRFPEFKNVRLAGDSEFVQAPPSKGTYVLVHFPYWLGSTATVLKTLYLGKMVNPEEGVYQIRDSRATRISGKEELTLGEGNDRAVLGNELITALRTICDKVVLLGKYDNTGTALPNWAGVKADMEIIKQMLPSDILSDIKIGKGTDVLS